MNTIISRLFPIFRIVNSLKEKVVQQKINFTTIVPPPQKIAEVKPRNAVQLEPGLVIIKNGLSPEEQQSLASLSLSIGSSLEKNKRSTRFNFRKYTN